MSKIKVIDLLNMISKGEELPKIKIGDKEYHYCKSCKVYEDEKARDIRININEYCLNDEVEIIEEEPEIDIQGIEGIEVEVISQCDNWLQDKNEEITAEINPYIIDCIRKNTLNFNNKINELIKAVKKLDKQINNK